MSAAYPLQIPALFDFHPWSFVLNPFLDAQASVGVTLSLSEPVSHSFSLPHLCQSAAVERGYAKCKIMQSAKLCKLHNYAKCKTTQGKKPAKCKIMQSAKCYAKCECVLVWKWESMHQPEAVTGNQRHSAPVSICSTSASSSFWSLFAVHASCFVKNP